MTEKIDQMELTANEIEEMCQMTVYDDNGKHFTEMHSEEFLNKLEENGFIRIHRFNPSGKPVSFPDDWQYFLFTQKGKDAWKKYSGYED